MKKIFININGTKAKCPYCGKAVRILNNKTLARHGHKIEEHVNGKYQSTKGTSHYNSCKGSGYNVSNELEEWAQNKKF